MPLTVLHSFVHASDEKVTSLTLSLAEDSLIATLSDKINKLRVKLSMDEIAGLGEAVSDNKSWNAFHTFKTQEKETRTRISYSPTFFNIDSDGKKIAIKLNENERAAFEKTLNFAFSKLIEKKF